MEPKKKIQVDPGIIAELHSFQIDRVLDALHKIEDRGNEAYLPYLMNMLVSGKDLQVNKTILKILGSIKVKKAVPYFMEVIADEKYRSIKKEILSACWQNDLDFSNYFNDFIRIIIEDDWETAFEAFTIIENSEYFPEPAICQEEIKKITEIMDQLDDRKQYLLRETISILGKG